MRRSIAAVAMIATASFLLGARQAAIIQAERIELVDADGNARIILAVGDHEPAIGVLDSQGRIRIGMRVGADGQALVQVGGGENSVALGARAPSDGPAAIWQCGKSSVTIAFKDGAPVGLAVHENQTRQFVP